MHMSPSSYKSRRDRFRSLDTMSLVTSPHRIRHHRSPRSPGAKSLLQIQLDPTDSPSSNTVLSLKTTICDLARDNAALNAKIVSMSEHNAQSSLDAAVRALQDAVSASRPDTKLADRCELQNVQIASLQDHNSRMSSSLDTLERANASLTSENSTLRNDNTQIRADNADLLSKVAHLERQITDLESVPSPSSSTGLDPNAVLYRDNLARINSIVAQTTQRKQAVALEQIRAVLHATPGLPVIQESLPRKAHRSHAPQRPSVSSGPVSSTPNPLAAMETPVASRNDRAIDQIFAERSSPVGPVIQRRFNNDGSLMIDPNRWEDVADDDRGGDDFLRTLF